MYLNSNIKKFLEDLAAKQPAPGGGSAAALTAAQAAALVEMVCNFTIGHPKYRQYQRRVKKINIAAKKLREKTARLIDADIEAYSRVAAAFKLAKEDKTRPQALGHALKKAAGVAGDICRSAVNIARLCHQLLPMANANLITDVGAAVVLSEAAFQAAMLNVEVNLAYLKDEKFCQGLREKILPLQKEITRVTHNVFHHVERRIRKK